MTDDPGLLNRQLLTSVVGSKARPNAAHSRVAYESIGGHHPDLSEASPIPPISSLMHRVTRLAAALLAPASATLAYAQRPSATDAAKQLDAYTAQAVRDWGAVGL